MKVNKKRIIYTALESFFGERHFSSNEENLALSKRDFEVMVARRICGENSQMECEGEQCWYTPKFSPNYHWFSKIYSCHFTKRMIVAESSTKNIFKHIKNLI